MLKRVILFGHTGSRNRGCDALVKSTADLFHRLAPDLEVLLITARRSEDERMGFGEYDRVIEAAGFENSPIRRSAMLIVKKWLKNDELAYSIKFAALAKYLQDAIVVVVGGDTYCYGYALFAQYEYITNLCRRRHVPCILWGCSVDEHAMTLPGVKENLRKYTYILPREQRTMAVFRQAGFGGGELIPMCDPAFTLQPDGSGIRPEHIPSREAIGINISDCMMGKQEALCSAAVHQVIRHILQHTGMEVFLIPHVFPVKQDSPLMARLYQTRHLTSDLQYLRKVYANYQSEPRVHLVDGCYNSKQFKHIISRCQLLIAARTHASIAAYSSCVPTIVVGYSIKAQGLALDLFGTTDHFVIMRDDISDDQCLLRSVEYVLSHREAIKGQLEKVIPEYRQQAVRAAELLLKQYR